MSFHGSFLDFKGVTREAVLRLFERVHQYEMSGQFFFTPAPVQKSVAFLFFEASTRTRYSFELAAKRLRTSAITLSDLQSSSIVKGESLEETARTIDAMGVDLMVIRADNHFDFESYSRSQTPTLCAGWGTRSHPTQALLDLYTLWKERPDLSSLRVSFVGDTEHSRVLSSHRELLQIFGVTLNCFTPSDLQMSQGISDFEDLESALRRSDAVIFLRAQRERHSEKVALDASYNDKFGLNERILNSARKDLIFLHPGPIEMGAEMTPGCLSDPRVKVYDQIRHGVYVRTVLMAHMLEVEA